eukprot:gene4139-5219_t
MMFQSFKASRRYQNYLSSVIAKLPHKDPNKVKYLEQAFDRGCRVSCGMEIAYYRLLKQCPESSKQDLDAVIRRHAYTLGSLGVNPILNSTPIGDYDTIKTLLSEQKLKFLIGKQETASWSIDGDEVQNNLTCVTDNPTIQDYIRQMRNMLDNVSPQMRDKLRRSSILDFEDSCELYAPGGERAVGLNEDENWMHLTPEEFEVEMNERVSRIKESATSRSPDTQHPGKSGEVTGSTSGIAHVRRGTSTTQPISTTDDGEEVEKLQNILTGISTFMSGSSDLMNSGDYRAGSPGDSSDISGGSAAKSVEDVDNSDLQGLSVDMERIMSLVSTAELTAAEEAPRSAPAPYVDDVVLGCGNGWLSSDASSPAQSGRKMVEGRGQSRSLACSVRAGPEVVDSDDEDEVHDPRVGEKEVGRSTDSDDEDSWYEGEEDDEDLSEGSLDGTDEHGGLSPHTGEWDERSTDHLMAAYMVRRDGPRRQMDQELFSTSDVLKETFIRRARTVKVGSRSRGAAVPGGEGDDDGDDEVDIEEHLLTYLMESYMAQEGAPGPASSLLAALGVEMPK